MPLRLKPPNYKAAECLNAQLRDALCTAKCALSRGPEHNDAADKADSHDMQDVRRGRH